MLVNYFLNLIFGSILTIVIWVLRIIPSTRSAAKLAAYFLRIFPGFCFGYGIINISNRQLYALIEKYYIPKDAFDLEIAGTDILFLAIHGFFYTLIVLLIELLQKRGSLNAYFQ